MRHPVILAGMMVVLAGCSSLDALRLADRGPSADLDVARLEADAARETDRVRFIAARAGLTQDERLWAAPEWRRFGIAAFTVACNCAWLLVPFNRNPLAKYTSDFFSFSRPSMDAAVCNAAS